MYNNIVRSILLFGVLCFNLGLFADEEESRGNNEEIQKVEVNCDDEDENVITNKIFDVWFNTKLRTQNAVETLIPQGGIKLFCDGKHIYLKTVVEQVDPDELLTQEELTLYGVLNRVFHKFTTKKGLPKMQKKWIAFDANTKCRSVAGIWLECMSCYNIEAFTQEMARREQGTTT